MDKKMIKVIGIVAGVFVVFIVLLFIIASCSKKRFVFDKFQDSMIQAAKKYYAANEKELPNEDGKTKKVTLKQLINDGYMAEPSKTYKDDTLQCDGSITVSNNGGFYLYSPSVTCGKNHRTQLFKDKLLDDSLVTEGFGLYEVKLNYINTEDDVNNPKLKDTYVYKGEINNNYVKIQGNDKLYRIIRINEDGTIRVIEAKYGAGKTSAVRNSWDDRYNYDKRSNVGNNDYVLNNINSRIKDSIKDYYNDSSVWPDATKAYIVTQGLCLGKKSIGDNSKDGITECSVGLMNQQFGLLTTYEYLNASLDEHCTTMTSVSCSNYNWLSSFDSTWTQTAVSENTYDVWYVDMTKLEITKANSIKKWNVVFNISDKVTYVSGDGTEGNPYIIK